MNISKIVGYLSAAVVAVWAATGNAEALPVSTATIAVSLSPRVAVRDLGRAPATYPVSIVVTLPYRRAAQLQRLIDAQGDPSSPFYHHFLTPQQFASIYGPTAQDEAMVVQLLRREGFTITQRFANRTVVDAAAPAVVAERYFHTQMHLALQDGSVRYFNARTAVVPAELAARAFTVTGLSNLRTASLNPPQAPNGERFDRTGVGQPLENEGGFGPLAYAQGYDLPIQHGLTGKGVKIAEMANSVPVGNGYVAEFATAFDFPLPTGATGASTTLVKVDGGCSSPATCGAPGGNSGDYATYAAYQEYLAALAPGIDAYFYQLPDDTVTSWTDGLNAIVSDNHADVVALGIFQYSELDPNAEAVALALDHAIEQGNVLGMTFISPSAAVYASAPLPVSLIPNDSPNVLSVGGSNIQVAASGKFHSEASCLEQFSLPSTSDFFPQPSYKTGIPGVSKTGREQPDLVAAQWIELSTARTIPAFGDAGGFVTYEDGTWSSTFIWGSIEPIVALVADIDEMTRSRSGLINTTIFDLYKNKGYGPAAAPLFRDITKYTPEANGASFFWPSKGYDLPTGIGSVDGWNLAQAIGKKK
jgi:subtilase family serine protease